MNLSEIRASLKRLANLFPDTDPPVRIAKDEYDTEIKAIVFDATVNYIRIETK